MNPKTINTKLSLVCMLVSNNEMSQARRMVSIIKKYGAVNKWELMDKTKLSISTYNKLKPFVCYKWDSEIQYDKANDTWSVIEGISIVKEPLQQELPRDE